MQPFALFEGNENTRALGLVPMMLPTSVVPILWNDGTTVRPIGTAWCLNATLGLFVSAQHILIGIESVEASPLGYQTIPDPNIYICVPNGPGARDKLGVRVTSVSADVSGELILFAVELGGFPAGVREFLSELPVSTYRPGVGEEALLLGYPDRETVKSTGDGEQFQKTMEFRASRGPILDVFPYRRDSFSGPFPSFHVSAYCPTGMSGGPVFDRYGVVGVLSRGIDEVEVGFAASIAPILTMPLPTSGDNVEPIGSSPDVQAIVRLVGPEITVRPHRDGGGSEVVWC